MRSQTAAGALVPTGEASTAMETISNKPLLRFYATEEMNREDDSKEIHGLQFHPPRTTAASSGDCLLLDTGTESLRLNQDKIRLLIQAVHVVTSAPAHFWDPGARWFVVRLYGLGQLVTSCSVFSEEICWLFDTRPASMPCQEKVLLSRAARSYMNCREEHRSRRHGDSS